MVLRVSAGRMVGRDDEIGRLLRLLAEGEGGRSVVALVSGDAGVGKSRLVAEATRLAAGGGFTVLSGQCAELGDSVPYLPLADALRGAAQAAAVRDALSSRPALSMLLPEGGGGSIVDSDRSGLARQQMFGGVLGLLTELAAAGPVLLVLEDLHWADASTRDLVTFLSRMLHRERVALIGTYRTDDLHRRHPLRPVVAELIRLPGVIAVDLAPLDPSALAEHLTAAAQGRIDATGLNDIVARAEGNAYYAEELLAASVSGDHLEQSLPAGLAQHGLASHDIPGAFAASIRAGDEAERLGAPAEAHRHYDQALALWERVAEPEKTAGMARGKLGLLSATNAADSGDVDRAVHLLRRLRQFLVAQAEKSREDVTLASRIGERLAFYLWTIDDVKATEEAVEIAQATVDETPADPPTWQYARAVATYANTLLVDDDFDAVREQAENALAAARAADAPWVQADALVTLGFLSNREGRNDEAIKLLTQAHKQARGARVLGVELRAAYHLARAHLEHGD